MNVVIYIPDGLVGEIKEAAKASGKSLSSYLYGLHQAVGSPVQIPKIERGVRKNPPAVHFNPQPKKK